MPSCIYTPLFLDNKYTNWYYSIVESANTRSLQGYRENHHIIPKCLGGSNNSSNLAALTAREHFIVHKLLIKMTEGTEKSKMAFAANRMTTSIHTDYKITSLSYEYVRKAHSKAMKETFSGENNPMYGIKDHPSVAIKITFDGIEFPSKVKLYEYAKKHHNLTKFVMKKYPKKYRVSTFQECKDIIKINNENSRLAGRNNKGKSSPLKGKTRIEIQNMASGYSRTL